MGEWRPGTPPAGFSRVYAEVDALLIHSTYVIWYGVVWQSEIQVLLHLETQLTFPGLNQAFVTLFSYLVCSKGLPHKLDSILPMANAKCTQYL